MQVVLGLLSGFCHQMGPKKAKWESKWEDSKSYKTHQGSYANRRNADGNEEEGAKAGKRKVALVLGYCGAGFQGMQMNPGARTIEAEVENALFSAGAISAQNFGNLAKIGWSRAARTDKGVHAAAQIVACKLCIRAEGGEAASGKEVEKQEDKDKVQEGKEPPAVSTADDAVKVDGDTASGAAGPSEGKGGEGEGLSESDMDGVRGAINAQLPPGIRVLDIVRVTKPFDARKWCDRRRYVYLLPTFLLMDHEAVLPIVQACVGDDTTPTPPPPGPSTDTPTTDAPTSEGTAAAAGDDEEEEEEEEGARGADGYIPPDPAKLKVALEQLQAYRVTPEVLERFRGVLKLFEGNKRFHNFSTRIDPFSSQAWRKLLSVTASEPFVEEGVEWVQVTLEGLSFLLYMIRKIIAAAVDGTRGVTTGEVVGQAFGDVRMLIPIAPPDGLYLQKAMFTMYNDRLPADRQKLDYELDPQAKARVADFEKEQIVKHILGKEPKSQPFTRWLYNRAFRNKGTYQGTPIEPPPKGGKKRDNKGRSKEEDALEE